MANQTKSLENITIKAVTKQCTHVRGKQCMLQRGLVIAFAGRNACHKYHRHPEHRYHQHLPMGSLKHDLFFSHQSSISLTHLSNKHFLLTDVHYAFQRARISKFL